MGKRNYFIEELVGKQINYLTPESVSSQKGKWNFRCVCGSLVSEFPTVVYHGKRKSCGCKQFELSFSARHQTNHKKMEEKAKSTIGEKFNRLTVVGYEPIETNKRIKLICRCDCGTVKSISYESVVSGRTLSCGCIRSERVGHPFPTIHGYTGTHLYIKWRCIKQRCYNKNADNYPRYGGKGVKMCEEWVNSPESFVKWAMENGGQDENLTIDRIDPYGDYSPDNCRFITVQEQNINKRNTVMLTINNETKPLLLFAKEYGINDKLVRSRLKRGWSAEKSLTEPVQITKRLSQSD